MNRKLNFNAGPSALPLEVLKVLQEEIVDYQGEGISLIENSHRGKSFDILYHETLDLVRELMGVPEGYSVLFLGGGATLQFAMVPMNYLDPVKGADYIRSGSWSAGAYKDAQKVGPANLLFDGSSKGYTTLPAADTVKTADGSSYLYLCTNETIGGVQWKQWPDVGKVPIIADMSSDILSRPVPVDRFDLIFAGVQKNLGPAGAALVIIKDELADRSRDDLPSYLNYSAHIKKDGLMNTPPVFTVWAVKLVLEWVKSLGGAEAMDELSKRKSGYLYDVIDSLNDFYRCPVDPLYRSTMNVVFRLPTEELEKEFVAAAAKEGMVGLKGHRSVGGCRASIYNGVPEDAVEALAGFMREFARKHG